MKPIAVDTPWVFARAAQSPDAVAIGFANAAITWAELAAAAQGLAAQLAGLGVQRGDLVAVRMASHPRFVVLFHALQALGAALLPLNRRLTDHELQPILVHAAPRLLVDDENGGDLRVGGMRRVHAFGDFHDRQAPKSFTVSSRLDASAPLSVVFTSGTTASPKGVVLSNANHFASARGSRLRLGHGPNDVWLAALPLFHVGGLSLLARSVLDGSSLLLEESFDVERLVSVLETGEATMVSVVPTMLARALDKLTAQPSPRLRAVLVGGAALSPSLGRRGLDAGLPLAATYGMTEACSQICTSTPRSQDAATGHVGQPLDGTEIGINRPDAQGWGEILVRSASVTRGYLRNPAADAASLRDGWLRTGDRGRLDEHGALAVAGRRSDLIVTGGENVSPVEVEQVLEDHPLVREALVMGEEDERWGEQVVALVVRENPSPTGTAGGRDTVDLQAWCRTKLAAYKTPREIRFVESLPRTSSGKLVRRPS